MAEGYILGITIFKLIKSWMYVIEETQQEMFFMQISYAFSEGCQLAILC